MKTRLKEQLILSPKYKPIRQAPLVKIAKQDRDHTPDINNWQERRKQ